MTVKGRQLAIKLSDIRKKQIIDSMGVQIKFVYKKEEKRKENNEKNFTGKS